MHPNTLQTSSGIEDQVAQAFENVSALIVRTIQQAGHPAHVPASASNQGGPGSGWEHVVKLEVYFVGLSTMREQVRDVIVCAIKKWCPGHQPLLTMIGIESLPFPEHKVEIEVDVWLR
ncbi:hypothetical protein BJX70DRAFT_394046 [Aspergillus crustosus]